MAAAARAATAAATSTGPTAPPTAGAPAPPRSSGASGSGAASNASAASAPGRAKGWFGSSSRIGQAGTAARTSGSAGLDNGAGVLLGYFAYVWVVLPLVQGGPGRVKDVFRAKFFNRDTKGNWLP